MRMIRALVHVRSALVLVVLHNKNPPTPCLWRACTRGGDYLLEDKNYTLDSFYDTNTEIFSKMIKKTYNNFRNLFDSRDKELWKQIKRDVDLLLWNNM